MYEVCACEGVYVSVGPSRLARGHTVRQLQAANAGEKFGWHSLSGVVMAAAKW